ncbi:hypothetical protein LTR66_016882, partial [Elasticomyces elasticus]
RLHPRQRLPRHPLPRRRAAEKRRRSQRQPLSIRYRSFPGPLLPPTHRAPRPGLRSLARAHGVCVCV